VVTAQLVERALAHIQSSAQAALKERGAFHLVLAGGSTPRELYRHLPELVTDWSSWHIWFGDERCASSMDAVRNSRMAGEVWLDNSPIPRKQIHEIPAELGAHAAAQAYQLALHGIGEFDVVLLGMGEDGHTASLFPGQFDVNTRLDVVPIFNAPKRPPERVSLSAQRLSRSRKVLFLISGADKRPAVQAWRRGEQIPAAFICPHNGVDVFMLADPDLT
jgi:6-phosphogluconolactonase